MSEFYLLSAGIIAWLLCACRLCSRECFNSFFLNCAIASAKWDNCSERKVILAGLNSFFLNVCCRVFFILYYVLPFLLIESSFQLDNNKQLFIVFGV